MALLLLRLTKALGLSADLVPMRSNRRLKWAQLSQLATPAVRTCFASPPISAGDCAALARQSPN
jgi:hypothetical protein